MAVDIHKLFNEDIPRALAANPELGKELNASYQINIPGEGEWHIYASSERSTAAPGNQSADCTITIAPEDFQKLYENPQANSMQLFFAGKLKISGDNMRAMKLSKLFAQIKK